MDPKGLRDQVLVGVGFDTLCRRAELVALRIDDIEYASDGTGKILVRRAKNDPEGMGRIAHLSARSIELIGKWQEQTGCFKGPLLRPVRGRVSYSRFLAPVVVGRVLKQLAQKADIDPDAIAMISGHSLRVGAAQSLVAMGHGILPIMAAGGWQSHDIVARYTAKVEMNPWG